LTKKGIERASADVGFIMTAYNIRRIINILGINELGKYLKTVLAFIFEKTVLSKPFSSLMNQLVYRMKKISQIQNPSLKRLYLVQNLTVRIGF
jgi:hypothetical protein